MTARNVTLPGSLARFVDQQVADGHHQSAAEVIHEALRRYQDEMALAAALQSVADAGLVALATGDFVRVSGADAAGALAERLIAEASAPLEDDATPATSGPRSLS